MNTHSPRPHRSSGSRNKEGSLQLEHSPGSQHDLPLDEYARINGLFVDSEGVFGSSRLSNVTPFVPSTLGRGPDGLTHDSHLPPLRISSSLISSIDESPMITKQCIGIIKESTRLYDGDNECPILPNPQTLTTSLAQLKIEPPLLQTDHNYDCRQLSKSISLKRSSSIDCTSIPPEPLDEANDEGLSFPASFYRIGQELTRASCNEKFDIPREFLPYLIGQFREGPPDCLESEVDIYASSRSIALRRLSITPPLLPAIHSDGPFVPASEVCQVPIPSDPSTLVDMDLREAEADILQEDEIDNSSSLRFSDQETSSLGDAQLPSLPIIDRLKIDLLRVEGPLIPQSPSPTALTSEVDLAELSKGLQIDQPSETPEAQGKKDPDSVFSDDLLTTLEGQSECLVKAIEQEQLQASDAEARIPIPILNFTVPAPEWQKAPRDPPSQWKSVRERYRVADIPSWPGISQLNDRLGWIPVPVELGNVSMDETIEDDRPLVSFLDLIDPVGIPTSAAYVWKRPGLAILQDPEDDDWEEVEPMAEHETKDDLDSLVRKRRADRDAEMSSDSASPVDLIQLPQELMDLPTEIPPQGENTRLLIGDNDASAAADLLSNYLDYRTAKRRKNTKSSFFPVPIHTQHETETVISAKPATAKCQLRLNTPPAEAQPIDTTPAPCPALATPTCPVRIIKSLTVSRGIFSRLTNLHPSAEVIERDFDQWNSVAWGRNSVSRSPIISPLAAEADIIVSPATGIVLTTLLRAIQKPLPGDKSDAAIRQRLLSVSSRYERLIVLVSEGNRIDETARVLSPSECEAYADFSSFVAGLNTHGATYYIGGGEDTLAKWLVSFIGRHASEAAEIRDFLIQEESQWELFLRRAGMNAYAAQAVAASLRAVDDDLNDEPYRSGLSQFVGMSAAERVRVFRGLLGGENVLTRVSYMLDTQWGT